jgi:hypothetical protein
VGAVPRAAVPREEGEGWLEKTDLKGGARQSVSKRKRGCGGKNGPG